MNIHRHTDTDTHTYTSLECFVEWSAAICEKQDYHKSSNVISLLRYSQLNCVLKGFYAGFPLGRKAIKNCNEASHSINAYWISEAASPVISDPLWSLIPHLPSTVYLLAVYDSCMYVVASCPIHFCFLPTAFTWHCIPLLPLPSSGCDSAAQSQGCTQKSIILF